MEIKAKPKLDLVFKKIFGDINNADILTDFLSAVLDIPKNDIVNVTILDNEIVPDVLDRKFSRLDLLLQTPQGYINIEIQVKNYGDFKERSIFYWSKTFSKQLDSGSEYAKLQPTISINIIDFTLFPEWKKAQSTFELLEKDEHVKLSNVLRIDFLELPKAKRNKMNNRLQEWLDFLNATTEEGLCMLERNAVANDAVKKAVAVVRKMSADERTLYEIEKREEALREEKSAISFATKKGIEQGIQKGIQQGELLGKAKSIISLINNGICKEQALQMIGMDKNTFDVIAAENNLK